MWTRLPSTSWPSWAQSWLKDSGKRSAKELFPQDVGCEKSMTGITTVLPLLVVYWQTDNTDRRGGIKIEIGSFIFSIALFWKSEISYPCLRLLFYRELSFTASTYGSGWSSHPPHPAADRLLVILCDHQLTLLPALFLTPGHTAVLGVGRSFSTVLNVVVKGPPEMPSWGMWAQKKRAPFSAY